jgi:histidyl-tRNA synthetase
MFPGDSEEQPSLLHLLDLLKQIGIRDWIQVDLGIVRGLAYYTGTVFEIIAEGERAIAGGGRYDKLIESFGGPSLPACGFGMGDVVLANILRDKGLLKPDEEYLPRPDAFVIAASDDAAARLPAIVADLRRSNLHVRQSYKTTRNIGKLLGDAGKSRARYAVILGAELAASPPRVALKNMDSGEQREVALSELAAALRAPQSP